MGDSYERAPPPSPMDPGSPLPNLCQHHIVGPQSETATLRAARMGGFEPWYRQVSKASKAGGAVCDTHPYLHRRLFSSGLDFSVRQSGSFGL